MVDPTTSRECVATAKVADLGYEGGDLAHLSRTLDELGPFVMVGISCYASYDLMRVLTLARFLKRKWPDVPMVAGGYHVSALPGDLDFPGSPFDAVVVGEGELPMSRLVQKALGGGRVQELGSRLGPENITQLDTLPPYRWDLLRRYWPRATVIGRKLQIVLSRGSSYCCTFCMERAKTDYSWLPRARNFRSVWPEERAMTRAIIVSMLALRGLAPEASSPHASGPLWETVDPGGDNGSGSWLALVQREFDRSSDLRFNVSVNGDGFQIDASWRF